MANQRERLDRLLVQRELAPTGARAQAHILAGEVYVAGQKSDKAGKRYPIDAEIELRPKKGRFASRGGEKLAGALEAIALDVGGMVALDIGSSTGGFTDCLLQQGASKVFAVDVGKNLLDWKLRSDPRVVLMEGINARYLQQDDIPELVDIVVCDASFISMELLLPAADLFLKPGGIMLPMVKPQFEVGKGQVPKGGVVRDPAVHESVLQKIVQFIYNLSYDIRTVAASPLKGPKGNREFFVYAVKDKTKSLTSAEVEQAIGRATYEQE
jgi:23S rRNA (cytidine1920-2'-O)/16S rRNA (cytidine1409-2'-O)-methyltransferase